MLPSQAVNGVKKPGTYPPIVIDDPGKYFFPHINTSDIYTAYKRHGFDYFMSRAKRKLRVFGKVEPLFGDWRHSLRGQGKVVFFDAGVNPVLFERLVPYKEHVILFIWNPLDAIRDLQPQIFKYLEVFKAYSHDLNDCREYGLKFNTTFYCPRPAKPAVPLTTDVIFMGSNKNRLPIIAGIYQQLDVLSRDFYVYDSKQPGLEPVPGLKLQGELLPYDAYLDRLHASKAILDILQPGQNSMTLRVMESLFYQKKLITNYPQLAQEDFYHPDNIFLFEDPSEITSTAMREFLDKPYHAIDPAICEHYTYESWIKRMI